MPAPVSFRIHGIAPVNDPAWKAAPEKLRRAFWAEVVKLGREAKDKELAVGMDRFGNPLAPLAPSTVAPRKSAMGPADPGAPPLIPAHGLSRSRALLAGKAFKDHALFYWRYDQVTRKHWGRILGYHRAGKGHLPARDVIGLSPGLLAWVTAEAL